MIEFDVDMGYLLEDEELDRVVLNDENGEHEPMTFWPSVGECEMNPLEWHGYPQVHYTCSECDASIQDTHPNYCPCCGRRVKGGTE